MVKNFAIQGGEYGSVLIGLRLDAKRTINDREPVGAQSAMGKSFQFKIAAPAVLDFLERLVSLCCRAGGIKDADDATHGGCLLFISCANYNTLKWEAVIKVRWKELAWALPQGSYRLAKTRHTLGKTLIFLGVITLYPI